MIELCKRVINKECLVFIGKNNELIKFCLTLFNKSDEFTKLMKIGFKDPELKYALTDLILDPLEKEITLMEEIKHIKHKELFEDEIGKPETEDMIDFLAFISNNDLNACEFSVEKSYRFCSFLPQLKDLYNTEKKISESKTEICNKLKDKLKFRCQALKSGLYNLSINKKTKINYLKKRHIIKRVFSGDEDFLDLIRVYSPFHDQHPLFLFEFRNREYDAKLFEKTIYLGLRESKLNIYRNYLYYIITLLTRNEFYADCENNMKKICNDISLKEINDDMSYLCENIQSRCTYTHGRINKEIQKTHKSFSDEKDENKRCLYLQKQCYFLEHYDQTILLECNKLREQCYNKVRMGAAEVILHKYLQGSLSDINICIRKLKIECDLLSKHSPELLDLCINGQSTCKKFVDEFKEECQNFQVRFSKYKVVSQTICSYWLKECYAIVPDCPFLYNSCRSFQYNCAEKGFFYDVLHDLNLFKNPFESPDIDTFEYSHHKLNSYGIFFNKITDFSETILTNILVQKKDAETTYCKEVLSKKCPSLGYLDLFRRICSKSKKYYSCDSIYNANSQYFTSFGRKLTSNSFSKKECQEYLPLCYFLSNYFDYWVQNGICENIKLNCYRHDIEESIDIILLEGLNGKFTFAIKLGELAHTPTENDCQTSLYSLCEKIMYQNHYILYKCLHPKETCKKLVKLLEKKCRELDNILGNTQGDFTPNHCEEQEKCNNLKSCSRYTLGLCRNLKIYCEYLDERKKLKLAMLTNQTSLQTEAICVNRFRKYCLQNNTGYACTDIQYTCGHMHNETQNDCKRLLGFLISYKNRYNTLTYISYNHCSYFRNQCVLYKGSCSFLTAHCLEIQKICDNLLKQIKDLNVLAKTLGEGISTVDRCDVKKKQECITHIGQEKTILCNYFLKCEFLVQYLKKACDMLVLKGLKYYNAPLRSMTECKKVEFLCSYIRLSCAEINDRVSSICSNITVDCKTLPSEPSLPTDPGPPPGPPPGPSQPESPPAPPTPELPPGPEPGPLQPESPPGPSTPELPPGLPPRPSPEPSPEQPPAPPAPPAPKPELPPRPPQPPVPKPESPPEPSPEQPPAPPAPKPESPPTPELPEPELPEPTLKPPTPELPTEPKPKPPTKSPPSSSTTRLPRPRPTKCVPKPRPTTKCVPKPRPTTKCVPKPRPTTKCVPKPRPTTKCVPKPRPTTKCVPKPRPTTKCVPTPRPTTKCLQTPRPTSSHDTRIIGAAVRSKGLQRIELIWTITAIILGLWIII
ncbi:hypothetical protein PMAC_003190 [Pneumocystis sp. 'macacae']|nr:hypothetical protein PMAC_003190 [Pneumocystis sp. 'macacae']